MDKINIKLEDITDQEWDDFIERSEYSGFMQSSSWAKVKKEEGWDFHKIALRSNGQIKAASLVLSIQANSIGEKLFYSPQGPVLPWHLNKKTKQQYLDTFTRVIGQLAVEEKAICWRIEPWAIYFYGKFIEKDYQKSPIDMQPRHTAMIPLIKDTEEILNGFKPKARYNIRLATRYELKTEIGASIKDFETFYKTYRKTVDRKSLDFKEFSYFSSIQKHLGEQGKAFVINITKDAECIESVLLIRCGNRLTYFFGGFDYRYRKYMAPYLCHFEAIKLGKKLGCQFYDLWGIANTESPDHPWHSFTEFKLKFNPIKISLIGAYDIIFNKESYKELFRGEIS